jgi:hypothetical protein
MACGVFPQQTSSTHYLGRHRILGRNLAIINSWPEPASGRKNKTNYTLRHSQSCSTAQTLRLLAAQRTQRLDASKAPRRITLIQRQSAISAVLPSGALVQLRCPRLPAAVSAENSRRKPARQTPGNHDLATKRQTKGRSRNVRFHRAENITVPNIWSREAALRLHPPGTAYCLTF